MFIIIIIIKYLKIIFENKTKTNYEMADVRKVMWAIEREGLRKKIYLKTMYWSNFIYKNYY